jgi:putative two-component system response regulator
VTTDDFSSFPRERVRILMVDDEPANTEFLRHVLRPEGYGELLEIHDPAEAAARFEEIDPDLVLLDLMMPEYDGYRFLEHVRELLEPGDYLPVVVVTGDTSADAHRRALSLGARDFLTKPLSPADIRLRVRNLLQTRHLQQQLREYNTQLEARVGERTRELEAARLEILDRLARAAEYRDDDTGQHTQRVGLVAARLATALGLPEPEVDLLRRAAPLHDIGKIGVPDAILLKEGRLTEQEWAVMEEHTRIGAHILSGSRFPLLRMAEQIAMVHHERWDGTGYPEGLKATDIPLAGRIVAVADVFDSLTHERPYKAAWSIKDALAEIEANAGSHFDPAVAEAMLGIAQEIRSIEPSMLELEASRSSGYPVGVEPDPVAARVRLLEAERDRLRAEVQELKQALARRDERIAELSELPTS